MYSGVVVAGAFRVVGGVLWHSRLLLLLFLGLFISVVLFCWCCLSGFVCYFDYFPCAYMRYFVLQACVRVIFRVGGLIWGSGRGKN